MNIKDDGWRTTFMFFIVMNMVCFALQHFHQLFLTIKQKKERLLIVNYEFSIINSIVCFYR